MSGTSRSYAVWLAAAALLAGHYWLSLSGKREWSTTSDEIAHFVSGHAYWKFGDFRLQPENGNLPQRWAALPAAGDESVTLPAATHPYWRTSDAWMLGYSYFYESGNDLDRLLRRGRAMAVVWSVACGGLIFAWSRRWFGNVGGLISLILFCLDPNFIAHGGIVTSDVCMTFLMLAAVGAWWSHLHQGDWKSGLLSALTLGLACVAKFSAVLLLPMFAALAVVRWWRGPREGLLRRIGVSAGAHAITAWLIIWMFFDFRFSAANPAFAPMDHFISPWETILPGLGWKGAVIATLRDLHALPEAFLYGFSHVLAFSQQRAAFLDGQHGTTGWVSFFPLAFLYKTPLALLAAIGASAIVALKRWGAHGSAWGSDLYRAAPLLVLVAVYGAVSLTSHLNIGHRHLLPIYPALFIFAGALGWGIARTGWRMKILIVGLLGWSGWEVSRIHPHELAYFNQIAGGPRHGWRHLADSSLDWGQDLPGLAKWLEQNNRGSAAAPVFLSYFGSGDPKHYGIDATLLPCVNGFHWPARWHRPDAGLYAVSATMLNGVYSRAFGDWTVEREREYQELRALDDVFRHYLTGDPETRAQLEKLRSAAAWLHSWRYYDDLRLARLCLYLRAKRPEAVIGYSIFIYRLSDEELRLALNDRLSALLNAIEAETAR